jgi:hypothetical protein
MVMLLDVWKGRRVNSVSSQTLDFISFGYKVRSLAKGGESQGSNERMIRGRGLNTLNLDC